MKITKTKRGAT